MTYRKEGSLTEQDKIMLADGYARVSVVAQALGITGSAVLRRVQRAAYKGVRAGALWYVRLDDVYEAPDTSEVLRTRLTKTIEALQTAPVRTAEGVCRICRATRTHTYHGRQPGLSGEPAFDLWNCTTCGNTASLHEGDDE